MKPDTNIQNDLKEKVCQTLINHLIHGSESAVTAALDNLILNYGKEILNNMGIAVTDRLNYKYHQSLLHFAIEKNYKNIVLRLLELGMNIEEGTVCKDNPQFHNSSPLILACNHDHLDIIRILIERGANLLHTNADGVSALMVVQSAEACELIFNEAKKRNCLRELFSLKDVNGNYAIGYISPEIFKQFFVEEYKLFFSGTEEDAIAVLERFIPSLTCNLFQNIFYTELNISDGNKIKVGALSIAVLKNYKILVTKLLENGININEETICENEKNYHKRTPLMLACEQDYLEIIDILLSYNPDLLKMSENNQNALMLVRSKQACIAILNKAKQKSCINDLIAMKTDGQSIFKYACFDGNIDVIKELMKIENYHTLIEMSDFLHFARESYWKFPEKSEEFDNVCTEIKKIIKPNYPLKFFDKDANLLTEEQAYFELFGENNFPLTSQSYDEAVKKAIAQFYSLLNNPKEFIPYLKFLNKELLRYFSVKHVPHEFGKLDPASYQFDFVNGLSFPIPNETYVGLEQRRALQEFLIALFRKFHLAENIFKLIGFVPHPRANEIVKNGDFFMEQRIGVLSFHNKIIHMVQIAMLIYRIDDKKIDLMFTESSEKKEIKISDILNGLVTIKEKLDSESIIWSTVLDVRNPTVFSGNDPYRLSSFIMSNKDEELRALSDSLIDTFCKSLPANLLILKKTNPKFQMDAKEYFSKMNDKPLSDTYIPPYFIKFSIDKEIARNREQDVEIGQEYRYAVIRKAYDVYSDFIPNTFKLT